MAMRSRTGSRTRTLSELGAQTKGSNVVADEVLRYRDVGFTTFIFDIPLSEDELRHTGVVFGLARRRTQALGGQAR
jgi:hypothetical protein